MSRKLPCLTIQEPLWQSPGPPELGLPVAGPFPAMAPHSHGQNRFPYWVDSRFPTAVSGIPTIKITSSQYNYKLTARAGVSEEGPRTKEFLGFCLLTILSVGSVWSPGWATGPQVLVVLRVSSSWPLCLGSSSQSSTCSSHCSCTPSYLCERVPQQ